ncbi:MAG TPA: FGGY-family carbohydrate kinase, partial [Candidatus Lokiarchaeia archaeon]|nr:FGGY-family carbohydrate kinase [Candidatus Lokiarchaeia archaeon]
MESSNLVVVVDVGTSVTKAVLVSPQGVIDSTSQEYSVDYPQLGWAEQDPTRLANAITASTKELLERNSDAREKINGLTFTSQMSNVLPLDENGNPLGPIMTWLDTRSAEIAEKVINSGWPKFKGYAVGKILKFIKITGGGPSQTGKDPISKLIWLKHEQPDLYAKTYKFVDNKDYAIFLATGKFITSVDTAWVTWLMDSREGGAKWSPDIFKMAHLDIGKMCEIKSSTDNIGSITPNFAAATGLSEETNVILGAGDLLASAIGSGAVESGKLHANIGTAGWVAAHFEQNVRDLGHYTGAMASAIPNMYLMLCKCETLGGALEWAKTLFYGDADNAEIFPEIDNLVSQVEAGSGNIIFTPYLAGERAPIQDPKLRAQIFNLGLEHTRGHILRAVFEGVAYNLRWGMELVEKLTKMPQNEVRLIGGGSKSDVWCQIFADVWQKKVLQLKSPQLASAVGAACIAFVGLGIFKDFKQVTDLIEVRKEFTPNPTNKPIYDKLYAEFPL